MRGFRFAELTSRFVHDQSRLSLEGIEEQYSAADRHLTLQMGPPRQPQQGQQALFLKSPTGSTGVQIERGRTTLQTRYFGQFTSLESSAEKLAYADEKHGRLLDVLDGSGAIFSMVSVLLRCRWSTAETGRSPAELKAAACRALGVGGVLAMGQDAFDFSVRIGREAGEDRYRNITASWYLMRTLEIRANEMGEARQYHDWDMSLSDEGLEVVFDCNNKKALLAGDRAWPRNRVQDFLHGAVEETFPEVRNLVDQIEQELGNG